MPKVELSVPKGEEYAARVTTRNTVTGNDSSSKPKDIMPGAKEVLDIPAEHALVIEPGAKVEKPAEQPDESATEAGTKEKTIDA